jgi:hypothetical protein
MSEVSRIAHRTPHTPRGSCRVGYASLPEIVRECVFVSAYGTSLLDYSGAAVTVGIENVVFLVYPTSLFISNNRISE